MYSVCMLCAAHETLPLIRCHLIVASIMPVETLAMRILIEYNSDISMHHLRPKVASVVHRRQER